MIRRAVGVAPEEKAESQSYSERLAEQLRPADVRAPLVLDLFAGCGGLALGFEAHGFEMDARACDTYRTNLKGQCSQVMLTPETEFPSSRVVIGGPPCQPFSVGGNQRGLKDSRDGFPSFISAVRRVNPDVWMFENVRGMLYRNKWYLDEVLDALEALGYVIDIRLLNAVDYGVPQNRERLIVVGHRGGFSFPSPIGPRVTAGEALGDLISTTPADSKFLTPSMDAYVAKYEKASSCVTPRDLHPSLPARTLTCRNLAGATGDMQRVKLPDGRRRRLLLREAARLQSFPDWFEFVGGETAKFSQVGNAVAPLFAYRLAAAVRECLQSERKLSDEEVQQENRHRARARQLSLL